MARVGIDTAHALGVAVPTLRRIARDLGRSHDTALGLWASGIHDARILATMVAEPDRMTPALADSWAGAFRSWDLCDQCCTNLLRHTRFAHALVGRYRAREPEFVKRTAFALIAVLAVHDKTADDTVFERYLAWLEEASDDPRNYVNKAVNWALRQIGKRNRALNEAATACAARLKARNERAARWIGTNAFRELTDEKIRARLKG